MSSRRSSRSSAGKSNRTPIQPSIRRGLESLVIVGDNASYIAKMLSVDIDADADASANTAGGDSDTHKTSIIIANALEACMGMNNLTAEMLLARFFDDSVLSHYCKEVLEKSGKGSCATLAARISKEWSKPDFLQSSTVAAKRKRKGDDDNGGGERIKKSAPSKK